MVFTCSSPVFLQPGTRRGSDTTSLVCKKEKSSTDVQFIKMHFGDHHSLNTYVYHEKDPTN